MLFKKFTSKDTTFFVDEFNEKEIMCHAEPELGQKPSDPQPVSYAEFLRKHRLGQITIASEKFSGDGGNDALSSAIDVLTTKLERDRLKREEDERIVSEKNERERLKMETLQREKEINERERIAHALQLSMDDDE